MHFNHRPIKQLLNFFAVPVFSIATVFLTFQSTYAQVNAPTIIDQESGEPVSLTPAYWNANVDIAGRKIQCDHYSWNVQTSAYVSDSSTAGLPDGTISYAPFTHAPLLKGQVGNYVDHPQIPINLSPLWNVTDGIYQGFAPISMGRFIELVHYNANDKKINQLSNRNAIRVWHNNSTEVGTGYSVCYAEDDRPFIPTGVAGAGNTDLIDLALIEDFSFQFPGAIETDVEVPVIYTRDTGEQVEFYRGEWRYNEQLAQKTLACVTSRWKDDSQDYQRYGSDDGGLYHWEQFFSQIDGSTAPSITWTDDNSYRSVGSTFINSFSLVRQYIIDNGYRYMELTDTGFRLWRSADSFFGCDIPDFAPRSLLAVQPSNCDYATASQFDGWGWNSNRMLGCPPLPDDTSPENANGNDSTTSTNTETNGVDTPDNSEPEVSENNASQSGGGSVWWPLLSLLLVCRLITRTGANSKRWALTHLVDTIDKKVSNSR